MIRKFIETKIVNIVFFLFCAVLILGSCALYGFPVKAVFYPLLLCIVIGAVFLYAEYRKYSEKNRILCKLIENNLNLLESLPSPSDQTEAYYQDLLKLSEEGKTALLSETTQKYNSMVDYYTVWAHQIKTPIAAMHLALQNEDSAASRRLQTDLNRIERYVEMVLTFLRLDSSSTDYVISKVSLDNVIKTSLRSFSSEFIYKELSLDYTETGKTVMSDEKWLSFVIEQVLSNAIKYTEKGKISVFFEEPDTLCIKDTGMGIAAEDLPRIFENGFTGFNGRTDKKASGIGLYLCKTICDKLEHGISASSVPGLGTEIRIKFGTDSLEIE